MDFGRRQTQKFTFKSPELESLRKLGDLIINPDSFEEKYGKLLSLLKTGMTEGLLSTLVQFYDPVYHCFTFPDYQLMPTLEEYSHLIGIPISDKDPFSGLEQIPQDSTIAKFTALKVSDINANMTTKGGILGLPDRFLISRAQLFIKTGNTLAFEAVFALLVYGLFLFPNIDKFVDINAIQIFLLRNPVPTLLADTYHSVHLRNFHKGGMITCCVPLLYNWFVSHLPKTAAFWDLKANKRWSQKIMSLTHSDINWYNPIHKGIRIIDSCGNFSNVPLIGTKGGINYNPVLALRQFGYPMRDIPINIKLEGLFFQGGSKAVREEIRDAWRHIHKKGTEVLGIPHCVSLEPYLQWVQTRAITLKMPYPRQEILPLQEPTFIYTGEADKLQFALEKANHESRVWRSKYQSLGRKNAELQKELKEKAALIEILERSVTKERQEVSLFTRHVPPTSGAWRSIVDQLTSENAQLKKQKRGQPSEAGPSSGKARRI